MAGLHSRGVAHAFEVDTDRIAMVGCGGEVPGRGQQGKLADVNNKVCFILQ